MKTTARITLASIIFFLLWYNAQGKEATDAASISKIYLIDHTLIRTTPGQDIKFYDISNPTRPALRSTINIKGNRDVAVVDDLMYADSFGDLIIFSIINRTKPVAVDTIRNVFGNYYGYGLDRRRWGVERDDMMYDMNLSRGRAAESSSGAGGGSTGTGGSLARFCVVGNYLYCIDDYTLKVFDVAEPWRPQQKNSVMIGWQIETVFPHQDKLFIGGTMGMYIYDIANQEMPVQLSQFTHVRSCDPVVVEGNRAYVTLRGGGMCGQSGNQLDILDITDLRAPRLLKTVPLTGPYGLTVRDGIVLVCDGKGGMVTVDARDPYNARVTRRSDEITPYDVILHDNLMIVTSDDGFHLYRPGNLTAPKPYGMMVL